ncbi:MAG: hypothetical protein QG639_533 [Patescibacteria group bacterium]|nr:hypothetical protein [Patescibacteria group bacterium]
MVTAKVVLAPVQAIMRRWWAFQHPVVPEGYAEAHRMLGFLVDNISFPGHPRVIFGSLHEPVTDEKCPVPLVPDPFIGGQGIVNLRYFFSRTGRYTYLPDAKKLFSRRPELSPVCCWRIRAHEHPHVEKLEDSLYEHGHLRHAQRLSEMRKARTILLVTQLNRSWVNLYNLKLRPDDAHLYEAFSYKPM